MKQLQFGELGTNRHDTIRLPQTERIQENRFEHAHDGGVRAHTQGNGHYRGGREEGLTTEQAACQDKIPPGQFQRRETAAVTKRLLGLRHTAEAAQRRDTRFFGRQTAGPVVGSCQFEMGRDLIGQLSLEAGSPEQ
jgi:hypothetical protein